MKEKIYVCIIITNLVPESLPVPAIKTSLEAGPLICRDKMPNWLKLSALLYCPNSVQKRGSPRCCVPNIAIARQETRIS